jgi:hypothetical protein
VNARLAAHGRDRLIYEVKTTFSMVRATIEDASSDRFSFRTTVYPKPTSNAQKSPFFAVFMAFHGLIFTEGMAPTNAAALMKALDDLATRIQVDKSM